MRPDHDRRDGTSCCTFFGAVSLLRANHTLRQLQSSDWPLNLWHCTLHVLDTKRASHMPPLSSIPCHPQYHDQPLWFGRALSGTDVIAPLLASAANVFLSPCQVYKLLEAQRLGAPYQDQFRSALGALQIGPLPRFSSPVIWQFLHTILVQLSLRSLSLRRVPIEVNQCLSLIALDVRDNCIDSVSWWFSFIAFSELFVRFRQSPQQPGTSPTTSKAFKGQRGKPKRHQVAAVPSAASVTLSVCPSHQCT